MNREGYIREELAWKLPLMDAELAKEADPFKRFIIELMYSSVQGTLERHEMLRDWCVQQEVPLAYERGQYIIKWCGSFDIARALESLYQCMDRSEWWRLFGESWSSSDDAAHIRDFLEVLLAEATPSELRLAMSPAELKALDALSMSVTVYRGCYEHNADGLSWSLSRDIAASFPSLARYKATGKQPLLITGSAWKGSLILKLDRNEQEVLSGGVFFESQENL